MLKSRRVGMLGIVVIVRAATLHGDGLNADGDWQAWCGVGALGEVRDWKLKMEVLFLPGSAGAYPVN